MSNILLINSQVPCSVLAPIISPDKTHSLNSADVKNQDDSFSKDTDLSEIYTGDVVSVHLFLMEF